MLSCLSKPALRCRSVNRLQFLRKLSLQEIQTLKTQHQYLGRTRLDVETPSLKPSAAGSGSTAPKPVTEREIASTRFMPRKNVIKLVRFS